MKYTFRKRRKRSTTH